MCVGDLCHNRGRNIFDFVSWEVKKITPENVTSVTDLKLRFLYSKGSFQEKARISPYDPVSICVTLAGLRTSSAGHI